MENFFTQQQFKKLLDAPFTALIKHIDASRDAIVKAVKGDKDMVKAMDNQSKALVAVARSIENSEKKETKVELNLSELSGVLTGILQQLEMIAKKEVNTGAIEDRLDAIYGRLEENDPRVLGEKFDAMEAVFNSDAKKKQTAYFDDNQLNKFLGALSSAQGTVSTQGGAKTASKFVTQTLTITDADTEYPFTFPAGTIVWTMKLRTAGATLYYSSSTGTLPVSGDDSDYITLLPGVSAASMDQVEWGGKKMYFESDTAGQTVEFIIGQL